MIKIGRADKYSGMDNVANPLDISYFLCARNSPHLANLHFVLDVSDILLYVPNFLLQLFSTSLHLVLNTEHKSCCDQNVHGVYFTSKIISVLTNKRELKYTFYTNDSL